MKLRIRKEDAEYVQKLKLMEDVFVIETPQEIPKVFEKYLASNQSGSAKGSIDIERIDKSIWLPDPESSIFIESIFFDEPICDNNCRKGKIKNQSPSLNL